VHVPLPQSLWQWHVHNVNALLNLIAIR